MRYLILLSFLFIGGINSQVEAQTDAIEQYFDQYLEDERFTVVYISSKMFQMISKIDLEASEDPDAKVALEMVSDLRGLRILTTEEDPKAFYKEAISKINTNEYEVLMTIRDGEDNVRFWVKENADTIEELLLLVGGDDDFVMLSFVGNIDLNKISKLANQIDVKGAEHLEKVGDGDDTPNNRD